jgi:hypothetical protein
MNSKYNKEYLKYQKKYQNLINLIGGTKPNVEYQLTQYDLFDTVTYQGKPYLIINKDYENGFYSLVNEQTGEEIKADEEMLRIKSPYVQKREPPREQLTEPPVLTKRVTYADQVFKPDLSVSKQKQQLKVSSEQIANDILQRIHPSLRLDNQSYPPTLERASEIIYIKNSVLQESIPNIPSGNVQQVISLVEDRIENMYRLTALKNIQNPPEAALRDALYSQDSSLKLVKDAVDPSKINYGKKSEYKREPQLRQLMESRPRQVTDQTLKAVQRQSQVQQLEERFKSLPSQMSEKIASDLGPGYRFDPNYFSIKQEQIPVTSRKFEDENTRFIREYERKYEQRQTKPFQDLRADTSRYKIATSGLPKSQRKKRYRELSASRLEAFRKEQGLPKSIPLDELKLEYEIYNSMPDFDFDY